MKNDKLPKKNDIRGWIKRLEEFQSDLCLKAVGLGMLPKPQQDALSRILRNYIESRTNFIIKRHPVSGDVLEKIEFYLLRDDWRQRRIQILKENTGDAMALGFDPSLTDDQRSKYFKKLGIFISLFAEYGPSARKLPYNVEVRKMQCAQMLIMALAYQNEWPSNKELSEASKRGGNNYSEKDFSDFSEDAKCRNHLKKEKRGRVSRQAS